MYLDRLSVVNLCSGSEPITYTGTFEYKIVKLMASFTPWIKSYKHKILIDQISIIDFEYSDTIKIGNEEHFSLARLLPEEFGDLGGRLAAIRPKMERSGFGNLLEDKNYAPLKIIPQIKSPDAYKLAFLLTCYENKFEGLRSWSINSIEWNNVEKEDALQEFFERRMTFFSRYDFPDGWFNIRTAYAMTEYDLLLEEEKIYPWIVEWMNKGDNANHRKQFLTDAGFRDASDLAIQIRRKFKNEESIHEKDLAEAFSEDVEGLEAILDWIKHRFNIIELKSARDISLRKILDYYWVVHYRIPEEVPILQSVTNSNKIQIQFISPDWNKVRYITALAKEKTNLWKQIIEEGDYLFIFTSREDGDKFREGILLKKKVSEARLTESIDIPDKERRLWEDKVYQEWKTKEKVDLNIYLLDRPVPFSYYFETENIPVPIDALEEKAGRDRDRDDIYIYQEYAGENIYQILSDRQDVLFEKDPNKLVQLLAKKLSASAADDGLFSDEQKDKIRNNPESYRRIIDLPEEDILMLSDNADKIMPLVRDANIEELQRFIQETDETTRSQILDHINLIKTMSDMDLFDILGHLLKKADKEQLEKLVEMWDEIEQDLERKKANPRPVALIGYIGERVIYWWLEQKASNVDYKGLEYLPYDISIEHRSHPYFIEVKTTIQAEKETDDSIPFFLRKSQYKFIQTNPDIDYIVVKLNLKDLGLDYLYYQYKVLGSDFKSIIQHYAQDIDEKIKEFIVSTTGQNRFKSSRMIFKMNIPQFNREFWED